MIRPATPDALARLLRAATDIDRELDTALVCLGVLPPLDLSIIRSWLTLDEVELRAAQNTDGHRIVEVMVNHRTAARIHHDGHVVVTDRPALLTA